MENNQNSHINAQQPVHLHKVDFFRIFWRSGIEQGSWNFERMQNLGFAYIMAPAIKRLYPAGDQRKAAMKRHLGFFNTAPIMQSLITGVVLSMEEQRANGADISDDTINATKTAMMGPMGGFGDPIWLGTIRPVLSAFAASLVLSGYGIMGPILFFTAWNILRLVFRYVTQMAGYHRGTDIINLFNTGIIKYVANATSIFGVFMMGVIVARWVKIDFAPLAGFFGGSGGNLMGKIANSSIDVIAPIILTLVCVWLIRKRISPIWIILGLFVLGIFGYFAGILV
ncbi:PTS system mannose/fructose/sorbose family transporter subunit IID [Lentilactobacillus otakiensis]|uniref:PTS system mannose-specific transporter subunit IID n=1 Tax=Lentilactobacillus otakiensis DSM 19908 = JCM 15040 TaxID=1423780 RepID=S4PMQ8_9LACO|nr:PTS system mannose/fructose/sorbose family transporter subunit IID [Lentilactobacillus otakiensis]KRL09502.1 PTS system mannose fructose sorbose family transporter subunit IID [Lentilactobacillus otakiensis DSM 19908 = JCM 15040]MBZ3775961.1 PTS system mannose/fructose/sorbose family transporter subunit IID [Lentilactobacillus otakiensis]MDV3517613.1 PTS system mannose/fructose/sorbose family transporter subunit IID [Lentilactobacillus otakiensis]GAD15485.1 PTS system mannose-specific transp